MGGSVVLVESVFGTEVGAVSSLVLDQIVVVQGVEGVALVEVSVVGIEFVVVVSIVVELITSGALEDVRIFESVISVEDAARAIGVAETLINPVASVNLVVEGGISWSVIIVLGETITRLKS